ncbi:MAG TPA: hypothetical protein VI122_00365 [Thermoleophilaceae bacterium]
MIDDRAELRRSAAPLLDFDFDALLLCDGQPLPSARVAEAPGIHGQGDGVTETDTR